MKRGASEISDLITPTAAGVGVVVCWKHAAVWGRGASPDFFLSHVRRAVYLTPETGF